MTNSKKNLESKLIEVQNKLNQQQKISKALLKRVKKNLKYQVNINETFEHNTLLLDQIRKTKRKLIQEAEATQKYSYLAKHDSLTGLYNRNELKDQLKNVVNSAQETNETHALLFLDLDQFKVVNDTAGHLAGDEMLKQISTVLLQALNPQETLARLGGDEFGILIQNCSKAQVQKTATNLLELIDEFHFSWDDKLFTVTVSIGVVIIDKNTHSYIDAQKNADIACYAAKNSGRNQFHIFQNKDDEQLQQNAEMLWIPILTNALKNDLFCLYVQPIKPANPDINHIYYELLLRLNIDGEIILPGVFLPPAERYNLITKIDSWVINKTFECISAHIENCYDRTHFTINLSGQSLGDNNILSLITSLLKKHKKIAHKIHFEVTETMAIANFQLANSFIKKIKAYGCGFSLDDFGSGLSSLSYLKNLDVDTLKVDGVFIRDIIDDPIDEEMVRSINKIGHVMGLKTVAEYVESKEIADKLIEMGFDYLQGNYIGEPTQLSDLLH